MIKAELDAIKQAMMDDNPEVGGSLAHTWHCNIASMCADAVMEHSMLGESDAWVIGNDAASRFMKLCFDVETKG